jgi:hypothetical protein
LQRDQFLRKRLVSTRSRSRSRKAILDAGQPTKTDPSYALARLLRARNQRPRSRAA